MPEYAGLFLKMPVKASGMDFTHKCRHFPNPEPWGFILFCVNNESIDQPVHPCSLISKFVVDSLEGIIDKFASYKISIF